MMDTPYIAEVAALIGDPARANMLLALKDDGVLSATELAHVAGVAANTASGHLARLTEAQIVTVERKGRHRYYCLAGDAVAEWLILKTFFRAGHGEKLAIERTTVI